MLISTAGTLQTKDGCTALDVARQYSVDELISLLEPSIWTDIGSDLLRILQGHFHNLIRLEIGKFVETAQLYLPSLELLTELREEEDEVWFPIQLDRKAAVSPDYTNTIRVIQIQRDILTTFFRGTFTGLLVVTNYLLRLEISKETMRIYHIELRKTGYLGYIDTLMYSLDIFKEIMEIYYIKL